MIGRTCSGTESGIDGWTQHTVATGKKPFHAIAPQTHTDSLTQTHPVVDLIFLEWTRDALDWNNFKWLLPFFLNSCYLFFYFYIRLFPTFLYVWCWKYHKFLVAKNNKKKKTMRLTSVFSRSSRKSMSIILCHDYYSLI